MLHSFTAKMQDLELGRGHLIVDTPRKAIDAPKGRIVAARNPEEPFRTHHQPLNAPEFRLGETLQHGRLQLQQGYPCFASNDISISYRCLGCYGVALILENSLQLLRK